MNINSYTIKTQEALQQAVELTRRNGQQAIEPQHLLKAVIEQGESLTDFLFAKLGMNKATIVAAVDKLIEKLPHVTGGEPYLSRETNQVLQTAEDVAHKMKDKYVSLEHLLLAILMTRSEVSTLLKDAGATEQMLQSAIDELRKGKNVTSQSAEDQYNALEKYAINLCQRARDGKLDPVIGRDEEIRRVLQILSRRTKKQSDPHRRARCGQDGHSGGIGTPYRAW